MSKTTVGEALVAGLKARGVTCVFGIPGVHTVELYRGLAVSGIRHITPRHEQGAGFMADGYARVSGQPGVAFVITGPGLTNTLTPMAQARADSVPVLVVSGVNATGTLGKGRGHLHELPDQHALAKTVALTSEHVARPEDLDAALDRAFAPFTAGRPGPAHIQIPLDVAGASARDGTPQPATARPPLDPDQISKAANRFSTADKVVILAGGGAKRASAELQALAEHLDAPVVQTVNARGLMHGHALTVPASPSLQAVRTLIEDADCVLALGTELGPTDYDMYATGSMARMPELIRVDICADQLARHAAEITITGRAGEAAAALLDALPALPKQSEGAARAKHARTVALEEIGPQYRAQVEVLNAMRDAVPGALMVGDSTQPVYAGNLYYDHDRPGGWFNAATGYGALGYGIPAAIGASVADPSAQVICIAGDGGAQFSLPEIMAAVDETLPITFVIWNNRGYGEIASSMEAVDVPVVGCDPTPPEFGPAAASFGIPYTRVPMEPQAIAAALQEASRRGTPSLVEIEITGSSPAQE
ncbi:5-guanidino-2-oxopentanoate decarboxylase [Leisingera aquaemixtae]|uniref:5-guanidino-2-oxopentanoate decarboxylase n=1 Tax=Leisingera aquaemixtae TaxID=1396826 RepID=A0ABY5WGX7_9RHOB|nr:5-guanidino-2-oxopentanoate decarboxylase [Leisingera aquaemixtae]UWQ40669.1 5-guanidino-2-oxopentanoate decarboxylase [Leisingera aquaemixtae]